MPYAPVGISTYARPNHLLQTLTALGKNIGASETDVLIFSDAARPGDEQSVRQVRELAKKDWGFRSLRLIARDTNNRVLNNRGGMKYLLDQYGKCIFLEEDILTAPGFLQFMNEALDFYADEQEVLSITGYTPPIKNLQKIADDSYLLPRFSAWGFATWAHKFDPFSFQIDKNIAMEVLRNRNKRTKLEEYGKDIPSLLRREISGNLDALDVKVMFHQYQTGALTVYPTKSFVQNTGHDGSGQNCIRSKRFYHETLNQKTDDFSFQKETKIDRKIKRANYIFRDFRRFRNRIRNLWKNYFYDK